MLEPAELQPEVEWQGRLTCEQLSTGLDLPCNLAL